MSTTEQAGKRKMDFGEYPPELGDELAEATLLANSPGSDEIVHKHIKRAIRIAGDCGIDIGDDIKRVRAISALSHADTYADRGEAFLTYRLLMTAHAFAGPVGLDIGYKVRGVMTTLANRLAERFRGEASNPTP